MTNLNLIDFLSQLSKLNIHFSVDGEKLRCKSPEGVLTPALRQEIAERKAEILTFLHQTIGVSYATLPPIKAISKDKELPLSFAQERLWFLNQLEGKSSAYNMPAAIGLTGKLDLNVLQKALREIVRRHEVLRTSFSIVNNKPKQIINSEITLNIKVIDLQHVETTEREKFLEQQLLEEASTPFDLEIAPLIRCTLLQISATEQVLLLTMHHIVSDGWSMGLFSQELSSLYQAFAKGNPSPLAELPIQYADFAIWQREWLSGEILETQLNYWKQQLQDAPELLQLPTDRTRPSIQTYKGKRHRFSLNQGLTHQLQKLARESGTTLFMTLLAGFATLLYRYSGQSDILIGSPIANRHHREIEPLIGFFVNTLVYRSNFEDNLSFLKLLNQVRETTLKAYEHQDIPFELIVEALKPQRSLSYTPLFQVMFALQNAPTGYLELPELALSQLEQDFPIAKFDLTLSISETVQGLQGEWEYNTDLFDSSTIERIAVHFENLLSAIVAHPQMAVNELPLLTETERHQLLGNCSRVETENLKNKCIHQLFEEQVELTPDAVAVVYEEQQLTYQELNIKANQLARHLQSLGVKPEVLVGICVERSVEMVVGLLGILKAGGAYVPLDPTYPAERLSYMLEDSGVEVLLTQQDLLASLPSSTLAEVVCLDRDWGIIQQKSQLNVDTGIASYNLAYIIYTSGSTGQPKGVMVEHKNVVRLFAATQPWYNFNKNDVWTNFHSIAFDFSVWEIWGALFYGGSLIIVPYWVCRDTKTFYNLLRSQKVTVLNQTPSSFRQLIALEKTDDIQSQLNLRLVIFGGEALDLQSLKPWFEEHGEHNCQLVNMYGITETTVHVTYRPLTINDLNISGSVIGLPIPDLEIYILDNNLQPVPIGVLGQMYVGGNGLARGYLNRPELTTERFISHPFGIGRLYQTGDLGRYLPNGEIEYLGRIDNQVKIRGFRIELGEIEAVINSQPQIQQAVVIVRENIPGNKHLVAYIATSDKSLKTNQLREYLKQKLPEYIVPSAFVFLENLPLTPNGKIDRKALSAIDVQYSEIKNNFVAPRTIEEELLAQIWSQVLGVEEVGIYDNFFELGGDSLLSVQVLALAKKSGLRLSLQQLFKHQTLHELVKVLHQSELSLSTVKTTPFSLISSEDCQSLANGLEDAYPLTSLQLGMLFHSEYVPSTAVYHDVFSYFLQAPLNIQILHSAIKEIVARHPVLRTSISLAQFSQPLQLVHSQVSIELPVDDLSSLPLDEQEKIIATWIEQDKQSPFVWEKAPLLRFCVHQRSDDTFNLSLSCHHAILDGWSLATFMTELLQQYFFLLGEKVSPIETAPSLTFRDYVALEQETLQSQIHQRYWQERLADLTVTKLSPGASSQQHKSVEQIKIQEVEISASLSTELRQLARKVGVPLKSVLLAAHLRVISFLSNQSDIITGVATHGRPVEEDSERVLGLFLNTMPWRMHLDGGTWIELIAQTFEQERESLPFQQYPLAKLQQEWGAGKPLFETIFNYVNFHVYQRLSGIDNLKLLGVQFFEQTNFTLATQFSVNPITSEISLILNYAPDKFTSEEMKRISGYYSAVLNAMATQPEKCYEKFSLLTEAERHQLLVEWNNTKSEYPKDKCIHQLFEEQVELTPDAIAVVFEGQQLTYQQLNIKANQLAYYLQSLGVEPEVLVGICVERSVEMVVGLLGILKAGGAYVPLDPNYPAERLSYMLEDSGVKLLLTQQNLLSSLHSSVAQMVCLDKDWGIIEQYSQSNLNTDINTDININTSVSSDNLAYVIYTSGSTGQPKGTCIIHRGVVRLVRGNNYAQFTPTEVFLQLAPISFDASTFEIWGSLLNGAKLVVFPNQQPSLQELGQAIKHHQITTLWLTAGLFHLMVDERLDDLKSLSQLLAGGDVLSVLHVEKVLSVLKNCQLINGYGPTENTTFTCCYPISKTKRLINSVPLGRPVANTQVYILDNHLQPVPIGVPGEIYIGGDGLALGYLNRPELTNEKFIPNPFNLSQSPRLYRTGDLARYLPDGNIEFLGRIDNQVKIRGFRIELGEIEAVLNKHPQVQQSVVIVREDIPENKHLLAYLVTSDKALKSNQLREDLKQKLPEYMIPSAFVFLETLPLTPNGKIDRKALPATDIDLNQQGKLILPRDTIELKLAQIWSKVLNIYPIGVTHNFFELGGHSLLAVRLMSQIQQQFQRNLPLATLFTSPTIKQLAHLLRSSTDSLPWSALVRIRTNGSKPPLFCIHPAGGNVLCYQNLACYLSSEQPVYGLQSVGLNPQNPHHTSIEQMATYYIKEMQTVQPHGPYFLSGWSLGGLVAFEMAQQLKHLGEQTAQLILIDSCPPSMIPRETENNAVALLEEFLGEDLDLEQDLDLCLEKLQQLEAEELLIYAVEQALNKNLVPEDFDLAQALYLLTIQKLNVQAIHNYQPQFYSGSIVLLKASETNADFESAWNELVESMETYLVPGNHQNMVRPPHVQILAQQLQKSLDLIQT
jgi:amino acid adenylation domain-containing protein